MKRSLTYFCVWLMMLSISSCSLEEEPIFTLNEQTVFASPQSAQVALNGIYASMSHGFLMGQWFNEISESGSGLGFTTKAGVLGELSGLHVTTNNILPVSVWRQAYISIANANLFIASVGRSSLAQDVKDDYRGQAKFLRAFTYLQLLGIWGGVPLRLQPTSSENFSEPRATRWEVYDQIESDLLDAIELLSTEGGQGRVNRWAARALLAKAYFLRASNEDGVSGTVSGYWQKAKEQGDLVIQQGPYMLDPSFDELWNGGVTPSNEVIFKLNYVVGQAFFYTNWNSRAFSPQFSNPNGTTFQSRSRSSKTAFDVHSSRYPGDPRIDATWFHTSYYRYSDNTNQSLYPVVTAHNVLGWPYFRKFFDPTQQAAESSEDLTLLRYADVLLLMAEVENELGNQPQALGYVNQVLSRARQADGASATEPQDWQSISKEQFRWEIFIERQIELIGEGKTYVETRRRGPEWLKALLERHNANPNLDIGRDAAWSDIIYDVSDNNVNKNMVLPIPAEEIAFNAGMTQADQNPGY